jgi:hypothetical protein
MYAGFPPKSLTKSYGVFTVVTQLYAWDRIDNRFSQLTITVRLIKASEDLTPVHVSLHDKLFRVTIWFQPMLMHF